MRDCSTIASHSLGHTGRTLVPECFRFCRSTATGQSNMLILSRIDEEISRGRTTMLAICDDRPPLNRAGANGCDVRPRSCCGQLSPGRRWSAARRRSGCPVYRRPASPRPDRSLNTPGAHAPARPTRLQLFRELAQPTNQSSQRCPDLRTPPARTDWQAQPGPATKTQTSQPPAAVLHESQRLS